MAQRSPQRQQQRRDRISELPADILDKILGFLPIEEAARMAVLSTFWRDIWFSLTQLNFNGGFFNHVKKKYFKAQSDIWTQNIQEGTNNNDIWISVGYYVISKVLTQHNGCIRKFVLDLQDPSMNTIRSRSFDIYQWLLFVTQKGVEEIHLSLCPKDEEYYRDDIPEDVYKLPNCIFSCLTLRKLHLCGVSVNDPCILPNVTSLCFENVGFKRRDHPVDVPMRKNLSLRSVCNLHLDLYSLQESRRGLKLLPHPLNVEYLKLSNNHFDYSLSCSAFIHLMRICPKLRTLDIDLSVARILTNCPCSVCCRLRSVRWTKCLRWSKPLSWTKPPPNLVEGFYSVARSLKMFHTLKVNFFEGSDDCIFLIKELIFGFPELEKIVIVPFPPDRFKSDVVLEIMEELSLSPRASTKAFVLEQKRRIYNEENPIVYLLK